MLIKSSIGTPVYFSFDIIGILEYAFLHISEQLRDQERSLVIHTPSNKMDSFLSNVLEFMENRVANLSCVRVKTI